MALKAHLEIPSAAIDTNLDANLDPRRSPRSALRLETGGVGPDGEPANVTVHNLSSAGLLIETDLKLCAGDRLAIGIPNLGPVGAEIVWVSERLYGCAFEQALGEAALSEVAFSSANLSGATFPAPQSPNRSPLGRSLPLRPSQNVMGQRLNKLRRERGLTLEQVAKALGVSKPTVWAWEKGKARPIPERIEGIAKILGVTPSQLEQEPAQNTHADLLADCRLRIAAEFGIEPDHVRIMIEV